MVLRRQLLSWPLGLLLLVSWSWSGSVVLSGAAVARWFLVCLAAGVCRLVLRRFCLVQGFFSSCRWRGLFGAVVGPFSRFVGQAGSAVFPCRARGGFFFFFFTGKKLQEKEKS